jgi:hypothetical protein
VSVTDTVLTPVPAYNDLQTGPPIAKEGIFAESTFTAKFDRTISGSCFHRYAR